MKAALIGTLLGVSVLTQACATTTTSSPTHPRRSPASRPARQPVVDPLQRTAAEEASILEAAQRFIAAKSARDFGAIYEQTAAPIRAIMVTLGRHQAGRSDADAKKQGFAGTAAVRALDDKTYFIKNREHLARAGHYVYPADSRLVNVSLQPALYLPLDAGRRLAAHPVDIFFTDGRQDRVAAIKESGQWRFVERVTLQ